MMTSTGEKLAASVITPSIESFDSLIQFMEKSDQFWVIKDTESRFVYMTNIARHYCDLPMDFNVEGRLDSECPAFWSEHAPAIQKNDNAVRTTGKTKNILNTFTYGGREKRIQPFLGDVFPIYKDKRCIGTVAYLKKLEFYSMHHFIRGEYPSELVLSKPDDFFTDREFDVLFFILQSLKPKEIASQLNISHRTVSNKVHSMYQKAGVNNLSDFKQFCISKGYDRYAPTKFINPHPFIVL
jgi:DNA-binding CsgD family transcriptional regulator